MRIQFLNGGLANQVFQYIFARSYELSHPGEIMYMDDSYFALNTVHNGYELEKVFGIRPHMLSECFDQEVWGFILEERGKGKSVPRILCENGIEMYMVSEVGLGYKTFNPFDGKVIMAATNEYVPQVWDMPDDVYYHGYWINREWFGLHRQELREELEFPEIRDADNRAHLERIKNTDSVAIHIRRGDYVTLGLTPDPKAYRSNVVSFAKLFPGQWELFVFSDDIPWCKKHGRELGFNVFKNVTFVEGNVHGRNYIDLQLMSLCKGMIMSNSAFCFLAALLSDSDKRYFINPTPREI